MLTNVQVAELIDLFKQCRVRQDAGVAADIHV